MRGGERRQGERCGEGRVLEARKGKEMEEWDDCKVRKEGRRKEGQRRGQGFGSKKGDSKGREG